MKKRQLLIISIALLIIAGGIWGTLAARARISNQQSAGSSMTSLYLTGARVIPTVAVSTSTAHCDPKHIPTPGTDSTSAEGNTAPAIKPHLCSIPTFTEQDVRNYMSTFTSFSSLRIRQLSPHFTITRVLFVTNKVANEILNADTGVSGDSLIVCYVEVYGDFVVDSPFPSKNSKQVILHHGQLVFDGVTGNTLVIGVEP